MSVIVGVIIVLLTLVNRWLVQKEIVTNLIDLCMKVVNLLTAPIFVLFFLAMFVPWSTSIGGLCAVLAAITTAVGVTFYKWWGLNFLFSGAMSLTIGIIVGMIVSGVEMTMRGKRFDGPVSDE